jgi:hypothetical protein
MLINRTVLCHCRHSFWASSPTIEIRLGEKEERTDSRHHRLAYGRADNRARCYNIDSHFVDCVFVVRGGSGMLLIRPGHEFARSWSGIYSIELVYSQHYTVTLESLTATAHNIIGERAPRNPSRLARLESYLVEACSDLQCSGGRVDMLFHEVANGMLRCCEDACYLHRVVRS